MIEREGHIRALRRLFTNNRVVVLVGPRGAGKTTLARHFAQRWRANSYFFDLRSTADRNRLDNPDLALAQLRGLIILDEVHRASGLLAVVRELSVRTGIKAHFLLLSSLATSKLEERLEPLADLSSRYELPALSAPDLPVPQANRLWLRGGLPSSFNANSDSESFEWRDHYVRDFLERDVPQLSGAASAGLIERFWNMLAHCHGQVWNGSELARSLGVSHHTARRYLNILESAFIVRKLEPWRANVARRQVLSPRVYFRDTGLLHYFLGISTMRELERHPCLGASWEGFALESVIGVLGKENTQFYFWAAHTGARVDLLARRGKQLRGFEIRRTASPRLGRSTRAVMEDLSLTQMDIVHAGPSTFTLDRRVRAVSIERLHQDL